MKICDGNKACSDIAYFFSEISSIYPITPSSPMASNIDALSHNKLNLFGAPVKLIEMQSEAGAAGTLHGALISGSLASTFTASQGLLLMIPNMYKIAGEMLPGVIHVAARTIATNALSIFGDHSDIYATRSTGFAILASSNVYDAQNLAAVAHLSAIKASIPFLHFFDGFRTSHEISSIKELPEEKLKELIPWEEINDFKNRSLNVASGIQKGMAMNEDIFFQTQEARNPNYNSLPDIVNSYMESINKIMGTNYKPFTYYGAPDAKNIIIAMGSITDTIKLDTVFSTVPSSTRSFWVYNKSGSGLRNINVRLENGNQAGFRVNVDGTYLSSSSGFQTNGIEVRNKDSIRVFVELTSPVNNGDKPLKIEDNIVFTLESGIRQKVNLTAYSWDATIMKNVVIDNDSIFDSVSKPIVVLMKKSKRLLIALSSFQRTKSIERNNLSKPSKKSVAFSRNLLQTELPSPEGFKRLFSISNNSIERR